MTVWRHARKVGRISVASVLGAVLVSSGPLTAPRATPAAEGLPASVVSISAPKEQRTYPILDAQGQAIGTTAWRVVRGTGNCCENHLGATATGRLIDFGGTYLNYSDDDGQTWKSVRPIGPLLSGEGSVVTAPGGDIVGVGWDPYSGDHLQSFKFDAAAGTWSYLEEPVHTPFFDREWVSVIPGPITVGPLTVPYVAVLRGGWPSKSVWYYSLDGLTYTRASVKGIESMLGSVSGWLPSTPWAEADWIQPISESGMAPLNGGGALSGPVDLLDPSSWSIVRPGSTTWEEFALPDGGDLPFGRVAMDSRGWVHVVSVEGSTVDYRVSTDGGRTWATSVSSLPPGHSVESWDFRTNGAMAVTALAVHSQTDHGTAQDLVLQFSTSCPQPLLQTIQLVGDGDLQTGVGLGSSAPRFDFDTVVILADGAVATSFDDSAHTTPALAVEGVTTLAPDVTLPQPSC